MQLADIDALVRTHEPVLVRPDGGELRAAVALILFEPPQSSPEILFIERATREGDPWSGQLALATTAAREAHEEVGVVLAPPIGRLDDFSGSRNPRVPPLIVSPFVYRVAERPGVGANHEVKSTVWIPISRLLHPEAAIDYRFEREEFGGTFPAVEYGGYTVWGLTYRILGHFFRVLGADFGRD